MKNLGIGLLLLVSVGFMVDNIAAAFRTVSKEATVVSKEAVRSRNGNRTSRSYRLYLSSQKSSVSVWHATYIKCSTGDKVTAIEHRGFTGIRWWTVVRTW